MCSQVIPNSQFPCPRELLQDLQLVGFLITELGTKETASFNSTRLGTGFGLDFKCMQGTKKKVFRGDHSMHSSLYLVCIKEHIRTAFEFVPDS